MLANIYFVQSENKNVNNKKLIYFLKDVYGLGYLSAELICKSLCFDLNIKAKDLKDEDWTRLSNIIKIKYKFLLDNEVKKNIHDDIQKLKNIKCYKGIRHSYGLPVNGQRTRTNAKTRGWR